MFLSLIVYGQPCDTKTDNRMLLFNESMVMLYLYLLVGISDYNQVSELNDSLGIGLLAIVMGTFLINLLRFLQTFVSRIIASVRRLRTWL